MNIEVSNRRLLDGVIVLDKPGRITSAGAANRVKRLLDRGTKIGHAGTLDPFATGILLLLIGKATKLSQTLMGMPKRYEATIKLGAGTATDDLESPEIPAPNAPEPAIGEIEFAVRNFVGTISQRPPAFSALKVSGRPAYKSARSGQPLELKARMVRIDAIEIVGWQWPALKVRIDCGRGTYIRAIARDLGEALKTGGYLTELRRTRIGPFDISGAVTLEQLIRDGIAAHLRAVALPNAEHSQQGRKDDRQRGN